MTYATYGGWNLPRVIETSLELALMPAKPMIGPSLLFFRPAETVTLTIFWERHTEAKIRPQVGFDIGTIP
jgi:hypothetical protein